MLRQLLASGSGNMPHQSGPVGGARSGSGRNLGWKRSRTKTGAPIRNKQLSTNEQSYRIITLWAGEAVITFFSRDCSHGDGGMAENINLPGGQMSY